MAQDEFIEQVKDLGKEEKIGRTSDEVIISNYYQKNEKGVEKIIDGFYHYDSEDTMQKDIYPGCVYTFKYKNAKPTEYKVGDKSFTFTDKVPMVLITSKQGDIVQGINLNLCNKALRAIVLNMVYNMDPDFYNVDAYSKAGEGKETISDKVKDYFGKKDIQTALLKFLKTNMNVNYEVIFRSYKKGNISDLHYIEPWQWKYIPFVEYNDTIKANMLNDIHKVTGIANIQMNF